MCCSDHIHCCPKGTTCNLQKSTCDSVTDKPAVKMQKKFPAHSADGTIVCPDTKSSCPAGTTCCQMQSGYYGCCPMLKVWREISSCYFGVMLHWSQSLVLRYFWVTTRLEIKSNKLMTKKVWFYIALYPVRCTAQSALHFPPLADLFIPTPFSASLGSILAMQQLRNDYSLTFPPLSIVRYSFIQLSRLRRREVKENAQTSKR